MLAGVGVLVLLLQATPPAPAPRLERVAHLVIGAHVVTQFADVSTTQYLIGTGRFHEANPAMRWIASGPRRMAIVKGSYAVGTSYLFLRYHKAHPKATIAAAAAHAVLTGVVVHLNSTRGAR
jgi:hypothetical protein